MPIAAPRLTRRQLLLPVLLLAHAGLVLVAWRERPLAATQPPAALLVSEIAAPPTPSLPIEVTLFPVSAAVEAPELTETDPAAVPVSLAGLAQAGAGCDLSDVVQRLLRERPDVTAALQRMPRAARSVADALMLWDGHWIDAGAVGGSTALDPIRAAVAAAIRAAPANCRDAKVIGPRLLIVPSATGNQVLAFGSGEWSWAQLLIG